MGEGTIHSKGYKSRMTKRTATNELFLDCSSHALSIPQLQHGDRSDVPMGEQKATFQSTYSSAWFHSASHVEVFLSVTITSMTSRYFVI